MDIIPIQASAVPCERVFSSAKETMTARRNRIAPKLMEALQMLKFSTTHGQGLDFTYGMSRSAELEDLETRERIETSIPDNIASFIQFLHSADPSE